MKPRIVLGSTGGTMVGGWPGCAEVPGEGGNGPSEVQEVSGKQCGGVGESADCQVSCPEAEPGLGS